MDDRALLASILAHLGLDERFRRWTFARSLEGHLAARSPGGNCFLIAVVRLPAEHADALAMQELVEFLNDPANAG